MKRCIKFLTFLSLIMAFWPVMAQDTTPAKDKGMLMSTSLYQVKDQLNLGLVFSGFTINAGYHCSAITERHVRAYTGWGGVGAGWSRGMAMIQSQFRPVDFNAGRKVADGLWIGAYTSATYHYQFYPETHGGATSWNTLIELGVRIRSQLPLLHHKLSIEFSNTLLGLASRPVADRDPYGYSLKVADFIANAHSNMQVGSVNSVNHTSLILDYAMAGDKRNKQLCYTFDYMGYYQRPNYHFISHTITFRLSPKDN